MNQELTAINNPIWSFDLDSGLKNILNYLTTEVNINRAVIYIYNEKNNKLSSQIVYINGITLIGDEEINLEDDIYDERIVSVKKKKDIIKLNYLYIPLIVENTVYGLLNVDKSLNHQKFSKNDITLIKKTAKIIATGIYQNKILKERDARIEQLNVLLNISMLLKHKNSQSILNYIGQSLIKYGKFDRVRIYIHQDPKTYLLSVSESIAVSIDKIKKRYYNIDFFAQKEISDIYYIMSLENSDLPVGFIEVDNIISQVKLEEEQINFLKIIGTQLSMLLNNLSLIDQLKQISITDPLTGAYNYRYLVEYLHKEISRSNRFNLKFSLILIDIDDFKFINDRYGHLNGDYALTSLVDTIKENSRTIDVLSRYGGDEFVVVAPETDSRHALEYCMRILKASPHLQFKNKRERIKLSMGIATYPDDGKDIKRLIRMADKRLYKAKEKGKNQAVNC